MLVVISARVKGRLTRAFFYRMAIKIPVIPQYKSDLARARVLCVIARSPTTIKLDGKEYRARVGFPSFQRKVELAGMELEDVREFVVALNVGDSIPQARRSELLLNDEYFNIEEVEKLDGDDCYKLTARKL